MKLWPILPLLTALLAVGCGGSVIPGRDDGSAETLAELKRRVLELQRQSTVHELELERLRQRLAELERKPVTAPSPAPPPPRREVPLETVSPPSLEESDLDVVGFGRSDPPPPPPPRPSSPPTQLPAEAPEQRILEAPPEGRAALPVEAQQLYDRGYTLYHQGRYLDAEAELRRFLQGYPRSDLADNAQYWIGESRYARKDYQGALAAFRETVERYPDGNKVPDALLKAGQCFEALEDREAARETYREILERYPTSAAAARAEQRLPEFD